MERLTEEYMGCNEIKTCNHETCEETCKRVSGCANCPIQEALNKLAEYEQAEEDGLLIRVPHPVGTEVYFAFKLQGVKKDCIRRWQCNNKGLMFYSHGSAYSVDAIGKTVFLTKAEAEQALAKMKGET